MKRNNKSEINQPEIVRTQHKTMPVMRLLPWVIGSLCGQSYAVEVAPNALPTDGHIVGGSGNINQSGANMTINQNSMKMITNWGSFNIGKEASVQINQPSENAVSLNRVNSADPSQIMGKLDANGQVLIINPAGVVFGESAQVNVGGLAASSSNISDKDFKDGKYHFVAGEGDGKVVNYGEIAAKEGGFVALVGGEVDNAGKITAEKGQVALAAGQDVHLNIGQTGLVSVKVKGGDASARVDNSGLIAADGGKVWLTAKSAAPVLAGAVNQSGTVQANSVASHQGQIWIEASGKAEVSGQVLAKGEESGTRGGKIVVTGNEVAIDNTAQIDASGDAGGGRIHVGGGWQGKDPKIAEAQTVAIAEQASIKADAVHSGKGGTVSVWSAKATQMDGTITAKGGEAGGNGGKVETSSKGSLGVSGQVDVSAKNGKGGDWLLDPYNIVVSSAASQNVTGGTATGSPAIVQASSIEFALNGGSNVTLSTGGVGSPGAEAGNIDINESINKTSGADAKLTFDAANNITLATGKAISSIKGKLAIDFGTVPTATGIITLNGPVNTNGGAVNFFKTTYLGHATPVSTKVTELTDVASGNITFYENVYLAAPGYSVALDASGPQSGAAYTGHGGDIEFKKSIFSAVPTLGGLPQYSQALALDTSGSDTISPATAGPGAIILGNNAADVIGGTDNAALKSLTMTGPTTIDLRAGTINLMDTSGSGLTASSKLGTPTLVLNAQDTVINVKGGSRAGVNGYADYVQSTFDIGVKDAAARTLTVNADRSIKIKNHAIDSSNGGGRLDVNLNPYQANNASGLLALSGGGIILDNAEIITNGGDINLALASHYAVGYAADDDGITDGIRLTNSRLNSTGIASDGHIALYGKAPLTTAAGTGIKLSGAATDLNAGRGDITLDGRVDFKTNAGSKDGVIIGEGGAARVTLETTTGNISVYGDASGVGINPGGGSRYDGVILSSRALLKTASGNIDITGKGGGGDHVYIAENHGLKFEDTETAVVTSTGNINLTGTTGGKTSNTQGENSYGIYAKGNSMYVGSAPDAALSNNGGSAVSDSGNINITADSMELVNSSAFRLQVASSGQLHIQTETADRNSRFSDTAAVDALVLGNDWFNGSAVGVFQPGFGSGAGYGTAASGTPGAVTIGRSDGSGTISVASTTTIRDNTTLLNGTGNIAINAPLTVQGLATAARTLTLDTAGSVAGTGAITADKLLLKGSTEGKDFALTGNNLVNTLAADLKGALEFNNAKSLIVGNASAERLNSVVAATGITTSNDNVNLKVTSGDLQLAEDITAGSVGVTATTGAVSEIGTAKIAADKLYVASQNTSTLDNANVVNVLAASIANQGLIFNNTQALQVGQVPLAPLTANSDGSVTAGIAVDHDGIAATNADNGNVRLHLNNGDLTQAATGGDVKAGGLQVVLDNGSVVLNNTTNEIGKVAINLPASGKTVSIKDKDGLTVDTVAVDVYSVTGVTTNKGDVTLHASADAASTAGDVTLAQSIDTGFSDPANSTTVRLLAGKGNVNESGSAIVNADRLYIQAAASANNTLSSLDNANTVNSLSANLTGTNHSLLFQNAKTLQANSIDTNNGLQASGQATLHLTNGDLTQAASGSGDITAASLLVLADNGNVTLDNSTNNVATIAALLATDGKSFSYRDADALTIGSLSGTDGITTANGGNIAVHTVAGKLTVAKDVYAQGAGWADLRAGGIDSDLALNGGSVKSDSASVQAIAGAAITTANTGTDFAGDSLLLQAGNGIGTTGNKIHTDVNKLAAQAGDAVWLSQVDGSRKDLSVDQVNGVNGYGNLAGIATTNNGSIYADTAAGHLTVKQAVSANGSGNVDLRTLGTNTDLILDGAGISSGTGIVALTAARDIKTTTATGTTTEVATEGGLRLQAGGSIGESANRLDVNVPLLAAKAAAGDIWLNGVHAAGLTVGNVAAVNGLTPLTGATTLAADKNLAITNSNGLTITENVEAKGNGLIDLRATAGDLAINGATVKTANKGNIQLVAGGNITTNTANGTKTEIRTGGKLMMDAGGNIGSRTNNVEITDVATIAMAAGGNIAVHKTTANELSIGTVNGLNGHADMAGIDADGSVWFRTHGNMRVHAAIEGRAAQKTPVVLVADQGFYNYAGANAVRAPNGRWLIYDSNPTLEDRMGGLKHDFMRVETYYDQYPEAKVTEVGNGYLNDAIIGIPEQYMRTFGGAINDGMLINNSPVPGQALTAGGTPISVIETVNPSYSASFQSQASLGAPLLTTPPSMQTPVQFKLIPGKSFTASLTQWVGEEQSIESVEMADGSALPAWIRLDVAGMSLQGWVPADIEIDALSIVIHYHRKDLKEKRQLPVRLNLAAYTGK